MSSLTTEEDNVSLLLKYFPLTEDQKEKFTRLGELFKDWNQKINLISRKDIEHLYLHHILHSLSIAKLIQFKAGTKIIDVGTGGGFPGIPLSIMFPESSFLMVDSIGKKIKVVKDIIEKLDLKNAIAMQDRGEYLKEKADFVTGRAVTDIGAFYTTVKKLISSDSRNTLANGIIYLTGGEVGREVAPFGARGQTYPISEWFKESYFETKKVVYIKG
jgi:16S rRNA (guanine527-N7)-methyltransferase